MAEERLRYVQTTQRVRAVAHDVLENLPPAEIKTRKAQRAFDRACQAVEFTAEEEKAREDLNRRIGLNNREMVTVSGSDAFEQAKAVQDDLLKELETWHEAPWTLVVSHVTLDDLIDFLTKAPAGGGARRRLRKFVNDLEAAKNAEDDSPFLKDPR